MLYPKIPSAQAIIEICLIKEIKNIIISPGSRNAPLTLGFANNPKFNCYSIVDERCAGFFALGIAQRIRQPVVLICTSGSALLNYYPAVAEAFYSQIPLVIISADRPINKIDIGDGQTIRQQNVFTNHSLYNINLTEDFLLQDSIDISEAIEISIRYKGPVHINVAFEEPLYETLTEPSLDINIQISKPNLNVNNFEDLHQFITIWNNASKKLILVGSCLPNSIENDISDKIATDNSVVVMTETTSNWHHKNFISNIDSLIIPFNEDDSNDFKPDILITFGGMIVSKQVKLMLRKYKPKHHWHIDELRAYNTFGCLTHNFKHTPNNFFKKILPLKKTIISNYNLKTQTLKTLRLDKHRDYLDRISFSDLKVFEIISQSLPKNSILQLGNSSTIRYSQLFDIEPCIEVFCNRGTSGIEGSTSTAIGYAAVSKKQTILITGDVSFFYDSNALWNNYIPKTFKIIIINNGGGGIFKVLPGYKNNSIFKTYFETTHSLTSENLAKMYGFDHQIADSVISLKSKLKYFYQINQPSILEVFTPANLNDKIFLDYFKNLV